MKPTALNSWNTVIFKERTGYYGWAMYANTGTNRPSANNFTSTDNDIRGTARSPAGAWTHLAATYDGAVLALYVNGVAGRVDGRQRRDHRQHRRPADRRQHDLGRVLQRPDRRGARLQPRAPRHGDPDRHEPAGHAPDTTPPTTPTNFVRTGGSYTTIATSWDRLPTPSASRSTTSARTALHPARNQVAQTTGTTLHLHRPHLQHEPQPRGRGDRRSGQRLGARAADRLDGRLRHARLRPLRRR